MELDELGQPDEQPNPSRPRRLAERRTCVGTAAATDEDSELDEELAAIFSKKRDLVDSTATYRDLERRHQQPGYPAPVAARPTHLKGGARRRHYACRRPVHELETLFEGLTEQRFAQRFAVRPAVPVP